jgi:hypothetical protein
MPATPDDPSSTLEPKLRAFAEALDEGERALFAAMLLVVASADQDVEGFAFGSSLGGLGGGGVSQGADLTMVQIQSLVSQRQQAVTLATQMMQSMGDTDSAVIKNLH